MRKDYITGKRKQCMGNTLDKQDTRARSAHGSG